MADEEISEAQNIAMEADVEMQNLLDSPERLNALAARLGVEDLTIDQVREEAHRLASLASSTGDLD